jgi:hypothetical protein
VSIFSSIGKALGSVAHVVGGLLPGPLGAVANSVGNILTPSARPGVVANPIQIASPFGPGGSIQGPVIRGPSFGIGPSGFNFTGPSYQGPSGQVTLGGPGTGVALPKGYHINKSLIRAQISPTPGNQRRAGQVVHQLVKNQRMNVLNPKALRRAERRAHGFIKFARKVVKYYQPKQPKGRAYIKTRKRSR